jgi:hypothetical protein
MVLTPERAAPHDIPNASSSLAAGACVTDLESVSFLMTGASQLSGTLAVTFTPAFSMAAAISSAKLICIYSSFYVKKFIL